MLYLVKPVAPGSEYESPLISLVYLYYCSLSESSKYDDDQAFAFEERDFSSSLFCNSSRNSYCILLVSAYYEWEK